MDALAVKATPYKVSQLVELKRDGKLHLPDLQRGFVWDGERVRMLFDSMYRRYPIGSLLLWKPAWVDEDPPINVRSWNLFPPTGPAGVGAPEAVGQPRPGDVFVLDGQQRLTSLFRVLFDSRERDRSGRDPDLYVSLARDERWRDQPFLYRSRQVNKEREREGLLVPASVLFAGIRIGDRNGAESKEIARAISLWLSPTDEGFYPALDRANEIRNAILNAEIVAYEIDTSAEDENVIDIFGRLNQQAMRLTPADLAAARLTGKMKDFRARATATLRSPALKGFAIEEGSDQSTQGGFVDTDLLVRTAMCLASGIVKYRDAEKAKRGSVELYSKIEPEWERAAGALERVVSIFRNAGIPDGSWIPYRYVLLTPAIAFGKEHQRRDDEWLGWGIAASLWGLYGGSAESKVQSDARQSAAANWDFLWQSIKQHAKRLDTLIPETADVRAGLVQQRGVWMALLVDWCRTEGRSFFGARYATRSEPLDVHHIFPKNLFSGLGRAPHDTSHIPDRIGNLTIITASDNRSLGADLPEDYLPRIAAEIREAHGIPNRPELWTFDRYTDFCAHREELLAQKVAAVLQSLGVP